MSALLQQAIAAFALHVLWQVPLLALAAGIAIRIGRPHVRLAHALWLVTLLLCVVTPVVSTVAGRAAALRAQRAAQGTITFDPADYAGELPAFQREPLWKGVLHRHVNAQGVQPFSFALSDRSARIVAALYLLFVALFAARLVYGFVRSAALVRKATRAQVPQIITRMLHDYCAALRIDEPDFALSDDINGPALAGVLHPTLLVPARTAQQMTPTEIDAVLAHELAHLRRHDPVVHAASSLLLVPVAFHPVALWVAHRVRQTREMACDAEAALYMDSPAQYAHALLRVAERTGSGPARIAGLGLFTSRLGFFGSSLELFGATGAMEERMKTLMNTKPGKGSKALRASLAVTLGAIAVMAAAMVQVQPALASEQDTTQRLISGDHAREQLQNARHQLDEAAAKATTEDERRKIATARALTSVAEQQIAAASGHTAVTVHLDKMPPLNMNLQALDAQMKALRVQMDSPEFKAQIEEAKRQGAEAQEQMNSPEFKAQIEKARQEGEAAAARVNTPEFRLQIQKSIEDAQKQVIEVKVNRAQMERAMEQARVAQADAIKQLQNFRITVKPNPEDGTMIARVEAPEGIAPPASATAPASPLKIAPAVLAGNSLVKVPPVYPPDAKQNKVQGAVLLHVLVSEDGKVESLQVVSSPDASLSKSAVEAVSHWTYKPYLLNGQPAAVDSTVTVTYSLQN